MPIIKIAKEHKFGIISLDKIDGLLARNKERRPQRRSKFAPLITEINQDFVAKYNSKPEYSRESLDLVIKKALKHAKYKVGLVSTDGHSTADRELSPSRDSPYDTSIAWLELTLLCQCYGPLQEQVLLTLCTSLNYSPVSMVHIPSLIYIVGLCYQWLKNDILSRDVLRTGELILLKIVYLISLRLFYHHLTGCLMDYCTKEEIRQLKFDLEGFESKEKMYRNMPDALLYWKVALEVGLLICENYSKSVHDLSITSQGPSSTLGVPLKDQQEKPLSVGVSMASHEDSHICPILWHSLDIWQCTQQVESEVHQEAIQDLLACSTEFSADKWLEGVLAMNILCTASELSIDALNLVQSLATGVPSYADPLLSCDLTPQRNGTTNTALDTAKTTAAAAAVAAASEQVGAELRNSTTGLVGYIKGTRFSLPTQMKFGLSNEATRRSSLQSNTAQVATLNILGMQPDFSIEERESVYTANQTVMSYQTKGEGSGLTGGDGLDGVGGGKRGTSADAEENKEQDEEEEEYSASGVTSVGTQSLIANESIPDPLPSGMTSNATVLEMGSLLDNIESLEKSAALFASSNSKNLSLSNIVSPVVLPSGELESEDNDGDDQTRKPVSTGVPAAATTGRTTSPRRKTHSGGSTDRVVVFDDQFSSIQERQEEETSEIQPQEVHVVVSSGSSSCISSRAQSRCTHYTHSTAPLLGGANMLGSQVHPSTVLRHSALSGELSSAGSLGSQVPKLSKFEHWPCEVAMTYTFNMASIAIYGRTSLIQRTAMEGRAVPGGGGVGEPHENQTQRKYGLLELAELDVDKDKSNTDDHDFSWWSIRYGAILGLSRVNLVCNSLPMRDGMSSLAWIKLMERHETEHNPKVLQAFNIAKVGPNLDAPILSLKSQPFSSPLMVHIANGLSSLFLPPAFPSTHSITQQAPAEARKSKPVDKTHTTQMKKKDFRTVQSKVTKTIELGKPKLTPKPSFNSRTLEALNKIV